MGPRGELNCPTSTADHGAPYSNSSYYSKHDGNTCSTDIPFGPMTPHLDAWHHTFRTTSSQPSWPSMASDIRPVSAVPIPTPSPIPIAYPEHHLGNSALVAAIAVPILTLFSAIALLFFCLRRRKQNSQQAEPAIPLGAAGKEEEEGSFRPPAPTAPGGTTTTKPPPHVISERNDAYNTGLDTSSLGSRGSGGGGEDQPCASHEPPPPPYTRSPALPS